MPILTPLAHLKNVGLNKSPLHVLASQPPAVPEQRSETFFFAGRICGDRKEPNASWPNCGATGQGYSGQIRQKAST